MLNFSIFRTLLNPISKLNFSKLTLAFLCPSLLWAFESPFESQIWIELTFKNTAKIRFCLTHFSLVLYFIQKQSNCNSSPISISNVTLAWNVLKEVFITADFNLITQNVSKEVLQDPKFKEKFQALLETACW